MLREENNSLRMLIQLGLAFVITMFLTGFVPVFDIFATSPIFIAPPCNFNKTIEEMNTNRVHAANQWRPVDSALDIPLYTECSGDRDALAVSDGTIYYDDNIQGFGFYAKLVSDSGHIVYYAHLQYDSNTLSSGSPVTIGTKIANIGCSGNCIGDHIHFEVRDSNDQYLNNSNWLFADIESSSGATFNDHVWPANVDGDENTDILGITSEGTIHYSLSNGDGTYGSIVHLTDKIFPWEDWFASKYNDRVWPTDFNGDGYDDLVAMEKNGALSYVLSDQNGGFLTKQTSNPGKFFAWDTFFTTNYTSRVWPADLDGDGDSELVAIMSDGRVDSIWSTWDTANTAATFTRHDSNSGSPLPWDEWFNTSYNRRVWPADIDGDDDQDIVFVGIDESDLPNSSGEIMHIESNGNGTFQSKYENNSGDPFPINTWFTTDKNDRVWPMDIDGDGVTDMVGIGELGKVRRVMGNGDGSFTSVVNQTNVLFPHDTWFDAENNSRVWPANVDGLNTNGDVEMDLIGFGKAGKMRYSLSDGTAFGNYQTFHTELFPWSKWFTGRFNDHLWTTDIDGDGVQDFLGIDSNGTLHTVIADGNGGFGDRKKLSGSEFYWTDWFTMDYTDRVWAGDVNNDDYSDIVGIESDGDIVIMFGVGDGSFDTATTLSNNTFTWSTYFSTDYNPRVWLTDITGDGKDDIVALKSNGQIAHLPSNIAVNQTGSFGSFDQSSVQPFPWSGWFDVTKNPYVWPADVNGDGNMDILAINTSGSPSFAISKGDGDFEARKTISSITPFPHATYFTKSYSNRVFPADITGDGRADIVGISNASGHEGRINSTESLIDQEDAYEATYEALHNTNTGDPFPWSSYFTTDYNTRVWGADVDGAYGADIVAIDAEGRITYAGSQGSNQKFDALETTTNSRYLPVNWLR